MNSLENKIDFAMVISVKNANPNGDPLNGNRPRATYSGIGEISDVCIKRKIRNRLMQEGKNIFVQSDENKLDEFGSLSARYNAFTKANPAKTKDEQGRLACEKWLDVRSFGQVFAFKAAGKKGVDQDDASVSLGVRGPVSIHPAFSQQPISATSTQITKSVNSEPSKGGSKSSDTMGMKHRVDFGLYVVYGSINVQLASVTGFSNEDAQDIKHALATIFRNDASSARPEGSMEVCKLIWWEHNNAIGQYSTAKVHRSLHISKKDGVDVPTCVDDYDIKVDRLDGLSFEEIDGE